MKKIGIMGGTFDPIHVGHLMIAEAVWDEYKLEKVLFIPSANPPHKHDVDNMPSEGVLEEIYYFLFDPQQGFGVQCLYTSDGEIDEAYRVKNDELVEFPRGYHTTVGAPGYNTYFLWLMAGKDQGFYRSNDPDHEWVSAVENLVKKQG